MRSNFTGWIFIFSSQWLRHVTGSFLGQNLYLYYTDITMIFLIKICYFFRISFEKVAIGIYFFHLGDGMLCYSTIKKNERLYYLEEKYRKPSKNIILNSCY